MRKFKAILLILLLFVLTACDKIAVNEIHNRSINYGEITINDINSLTTTIVTKTRDSVIGVSNYKRSGLIDYRLTGTGSGVIYECKAVLLNNQLIDDCMETVDRQDVRRYEFYAVTNRHVIENSDKIEVYIGPDDQYLDAEVVKFDKKVDIAIIKFAYIRPIQPIEFADSDLVEPGNIAIAIGNPYGHEFWGSATFGIISSPKRFLIDEDNKEDDTPNEFIQHDVAINPGSSGGALLNAEGKLIGINTLKIIGDDKDDKGVFIPSDGMGFSIPSNIVRELIEILITN